MFLNDLNVSRCRISAISLRLKQQGSVLIIGIFIVTSMFLLASALIRIVQDGDMGLTLEVWGIRAFAAANSAADAQLALLLPLDGSAGVCSSNSTWTPPDVVGFYACSAALTCTEITVDGTTRYLIVSLAICESGDIRVSREVKVEASEG